MANPFRSEPSHAESASYNAPRGVTAAASQVRLDNKSEAEIFKSRKNSQTTLWQHAAWEYYDAIGEIKFAFNLVASIVSRIRLFAAVVVDPAEPPVDINKVQNIDPKLADAATRALARLDSAYGGQAGLLRDAALNLSVAGECYLVQIPERPGQGLKESWDIRSIDELQQYGDNQFVVTPRRELVGTGSLKAGVVQLPNTAFTARIWRAHPRYSEEPDSSLRGLLDLCDELLLLNRTYRAMHRSRLNAGLLYIPDGLSNAASPDPDLFVDEDDPESTPEEYADAFEEQLLEAMSTPIADESSANAVVPLLVRGPAELGDKIRHTKFERSFEEAMNARYDRVLERILQGLDVPKDTVTGLANVKYSNAIQIDDALYKAHIEPMLLLIADALTVVFLRPYLKSQGWSEADVNRIAVWYDPSSVATRNDRAAEADKGYENMTISGETWRRAHGFSDADAPTPLETVLRMVQSKASFTPEFTENFISVLAPEIIEAIRGSQQAASVAPIPDAAQQILNGAPVPTGGEVAPPAQGEAAPGEDGPPFPLAEPEPPSDIEPLE